MLIFIATLMFGLAAFSNCSNTPNSNLLDYLKKHRNMEDSTINKASMERRSPTDPGFREYLQEDDPLGPPVYFSDAPDLCKDPKIDAATRMSNGDTYFFKGNYYWRVLSEGIARGYPRKISTDFPGLEGNLDAALTSLNGRTYFFKDKRYWRFTDMQRDSYYPVRINFGFKGIPDNLSAALVWGGNGKAYFFKGSQYWRYDSRDSPQVKDYYPLQISEWKGLPNDVDAALRWENGVSYFFKGNQYWKYNDTTSTVDTNGPPYPRLTAQWWFGCKTDEFECDYECDYYF